jgi:hypothetical protein
MQHYEPNKKFMDYIGMAKKFKNHMNFYHFNVGTGKPILGWYH